MICDSTNVFSIGRSGSEMDVRKNLLKIFERLKKRIIVTCFASNVARMETIFFCAQKTGRQISLVGRSMHRIFKAARQCGYLKNVIEPILVSEIDPGWRFVTNPPAVNCLKSVHWITNSHLATKLSKSPEWAADITRGSVSSRLVYWTVQWEWDPIIQTSCQKKGNVN